MSNKIRLVELLRSHPVVTVFKANFSIEFPLDCDFVLFRFAYVEKAPDYEATEILEDDEELNQLVCFNHKYPLVDFLRIPEESLGGFYENLFDKAHTQLKIAETGEA
jgi:hypothetical protein